MAVKSINYRAWQLYVNKTSSYVGDASSLYAIDYSKYESINLIERDDTYIKWVSTIYKKATVYISQYIIFNSITYNNAADLCKKVGVVIVNGKQHMLKLMPASFWLELPKEIYSSIHASGHLFITLQESNKFNAIRRDARTDAFGSHSMVDINSSTDEPLAFIPVLVPINNTVTISGEDADLGDKTTNFGVSYSVYDDDAEDNIYIKEELNGEIIREISNAVIGELYTFNITQGMYSMLIPHETNILKITANDGTDSSYRLYTFKKVNNAPTIVYEGNTSLGSIVSIPTIEYMVQDDIDKTVNITEKINDITLFTGNISTDTKRTVSISNEQWSKFVGDCTLEIIATNPSGESSTMLITFTKGTSNRLEVKTKPLAVEDMPEKISLEIDWTTANATGKAYVSNNALDARPIWEEMTSKINTNDVYLFANKTKEAENWAVSVRVVIEKDAGSTSEINIYGIRGTFE